MEEGTLSPARLVEHLFGNRASNSNVYAVQEYTRKREVVHNKLTNGYPYKVPLPRNQGN